LLSKKAPKAFWQLCFKLRFCFALWFKVCQVVVVGVGTTFSTWLLAKNHWLLGTGHVACCKTEKITETVK